MTIIKQLDVMKKKRWSTEDKEFVNEHVGKLTFKEIGNVIGRSELAVQLYVHRNHIVFKQTVKRNLILEIIKLKFSKPEYFNVTKDFLNAVEINQMRFWKLYRGEENPTTDEYIRIASHLEVSLEEAFKTRQLNLNFFE